MIVLPSRLLRGTVQVHGAGQSTALFPRQPLTPSTTPVPGDEPEWFGAAPSRRLFIALPVKVAPTRGVSGVAAIGMHVA
jgi:hypothetical protein